MSNLKLYKNTWDTSCVYDSSQQQTQEEINSGLKTATTLEPISIPFTIDDSGYVSYTVGSITGSSNYDHTDYIDVSDFDSITYKRTCATNENPAAGMV